MTDLSGAAVAKLSGGKGSNGDRSCMAEALRAEESIDFSELALPVSTTFWAVVAVGAGISQCDDDDDERDRGLHPSSLPRGDDRCRGSGVGGASGPGGVEITR